MPTANKIFIDGPAWVGDMVMAQTLFQLLKQNNEQAKIDVLAPAWSEALLKRMPEVNRVWTSPLGHGELQLKKRYQLAQQIRQEQYDWAIVLRNSWKSALIPYWARIPRRTGWLGELRLGLLNDWRLLDKNRYPLMIERFMALGLQKNSPLPKPYPQPKLLVSENRAQPSEPVLALCPGAEYGPAKRWPAEYFAEVAKAKLQQGWQIWLLGSEKDKAITQSINVLCDNRCLDFAGRTQLTEAVDLLSLATLAVCNDSGLMHIAAAVGTPLIVLYGSSSAKFTPPLTKTVKMLSLNLSCSPCFKRECPLAHLNCLKQLSPDYVLQAMSELKKIAPCDLQKAPSCGLSTGSLIQQIPR